MSSSPSTSPPPPPSSPQVPRAGPQIGSKRKLVHQYEPLTFLEMKHFERKNLVGLLRDIMENV